MIVVGVQALTHDSVTRPVSGVWDILVSVRDADGCVVDAAPVVTITLPAGSVSTPTVETVCTGVYRVAYIVATAGRYIARAVSAGYGAADFTCYVTATVAGTAMPDVTDYRDYTDDNGGSWTDDQIQEALDAEAAAQRSVCRVPAAYPADLRQALLRRVARNLAMRQIPLAVPQGDADGNVGVLPGRDPEVRRLEGPWRKLTVG